MAEPMQVDAQTGTKRIPAHIQRLREIGCGPKKLKTLAGAFPTAETLTAASEKDFKGLQDIGVVTAKKLYAFLHSAAGASAASAPAKEKRVMMWNAKTEKKLAGAAAPRESEVDAFLARHQGTFVRFADQDLKKKGPNDVPEDDIIDLADFQAFWARSAGMQVGEAQQALPALLTDYSLKPLGLAEVSPGLPVLGSLAFALLHAAANLDAEISSLRAELQDLVAPAAPEAAALQMITIARARLKRPVWAFACSVDAAPAAVGSSSGSTDDVKVFQYDPDDSDAMAVTPIRIALLGGQFFALAVLDHTADVAVTVDEVAEEEVQEVAPAQLPDIKDDVDKALGDVHAQIDTVEKWSCAKLGEPYELSRSRGSIENLRERLTNRKGEDAAFLGTNGVGKSTIISLLVLNSSVDETTYKSQPGSYVPEALLDLIKTPPSYQELLGGQGTGHVGVAVTLLTPVGDFDTAANAAADTFLKMETAVKRFCEVAGDKPQINNYVLPCGEGCGSTTALHTRVCYGTVVHLLVVYYSVDELKKNAFNFVQLMRNLAAEGQKPRDLSSEDKKGLEEAWHVYLNVKKGPYKRGKLPRFTELRDVKADSLEKQWEDIEVVPDLEALVSSPSRVFLGTGKSIHLDRVMVHDLIKKMNDKEQLDRYAVKSVETYQPAGVLEGGNTFIDLPGQNDVDTGCTAQTREGIKEAGVVFVVLSKSLYEDENSLKMLKDTDTIKRAAAGEANVVFLFNREPLASFMHRQLETDEEVRVREELESKTRDLWRTSLLEANDDAKEDGDASKTDAEIEELATSTPMRTIYPMLHSSFKLNWEFAEKNKETKGELVGSARTFELSNVPFMLGILETLNRSSIVDHLKSIATSELPEVQEKLKTSLEDAKNAQGGLPEVLVDKAAQFLKGRRSLEGAISLQAEQLMNSVQLLGSSGASQEATSFRLQMDAAVSDFMGGTKVTDYLDETRAASVERWQRMSKSMKRMQQAVQIIDPRNKGNFVGFSLMPLIFGHNSRQAPVDFSPLVEELELKLDQMKEQVVDLVIEHVTQLLSSVLGNEPCPSMTSLKASFLELDVIKPLQERFSVRYFIKACQRDPMLNDGKLEHWLKKYAVEMSSQAIKQKILSTSGDRSSVASIKTIIEGSQDDTREHWQDLMKVRLANFFGGQFQHLLNDLSPGKAKRSAKAYSLKAMLTAFLRHIVNTDQLNRKAELQIDLSGFIKDLVFKTDALHSLWARLDGQDDPDVLGAAAARHVERRRQREHTVKHAIVNVTLKQPNRPMPVTELQADHRLQACNFNAAKHVFAASDEDEIGDVRSQLRDSYNLEVFNCKSGSDLFSAVAVVAYKTMTIKAATGGAAANLATDEHVALAAKQLRAVAAAQVAYSHRTEERHKQFSAIVGETVESYVCAVGDAYRGDLYCLSFLALYFRRSFRVWLPGVGSILVKDRLSGPSDSTRSSSTCAFQLMLVASPPDQPGSAGYKPQWMPVQLKKLLKVGFSGQDSIRDLPMTDDDLDARHTDDAMADLAMQRGMGGAKARNDYDASRRRFRNDDVQKHHHSDGRVTTLVDGEALAMASPKKKARVSGAGSSSGNT